MVVVVVVGPRIRAIAIVALLAVAGACGNDGGTGSPTPSPSTSPGGANASTAEAWLTTVCGATGDWIDEIVSLQEELVQRLGSRRVEDVKTSMVRYFDDVLAATDRAIARVEAAGVPDVEGGEEAADGYAGGLRSVRQVLQEARDETADLETSDPRTFTRQLRAIEEDVQASLADVGASMAEMESPELDRVAEDVPECEELSR
jgi:hypothetical protein